MPDKDKDPGVFAATDGTPGDKGVPIPGIPSMEEPVAPEAPDEEEDDEEEDDEAEAETTASPADPDHIEGVPTEGGYVYDPDVVAADVAPDSPTE